MPPCSVSLDRTPPSGEKRFVEIAYPNLKAGLGARLSDSAPHISAPEDGDYRRRSQLGNRHSPTGGKDSAPRLAWEPTSDINNSRGQRFKRVPASAGLVPHPPLDDVI